MGLWDDKLPAREEVRLLPQPELLQEVPRENEEVVRLRGTGLLFRYDRYVGPDRHLPPLVRVSHGGGVISVRLRLKYCSSVFPLVEAP